MSKHTPGPWKFSQTHQHMLTIRPESGGYVAEIRVGDTPDLLLVDEANARLISAAPELLAALRECRAELSRLNQAAGETVFNPAATSLADEAIAKAEGRKP